MMDTVSATLAEITATEQASLATFDQLVKAKSDEIDALSAAIEDKTQRIGDLGVQIVGMKDVGAPFVPLSSW